MRAMGQLPGIFDGDRSDAERFITDLQMYVDFNRHCDNILDNRDKVRFALTLIQGAKVKGWKMGMAEWVRRQVDDVITWNDFIAAFNVRFLDSQREQTAKTKIENVNLKDNDMDQYISLFEELAADADYDLDTKPVWNLFQKGLPYKINNRIFSFYPPHTDWDELKKRATMASNAEANIRAFNENPFGRAPKTRQGDRSFGNRPQPRQYNSTTAPPSHNNRPVPMDVGRGKTWRKGPVQGNAVAPTQSNAAPAPARDTKPRPSKFQGECWHCQRPGHTRKECRKLQRETAASAGWEQPPEAQLVDWQPSDNRTNPIDAIIKSFAALSSEEQDELAARFQESEDFQNA
jgi:hypothetical protein